MVSRQARILFGSKYNFEKYRDKYRDTYISLTSIPEKYRVASLIETIDTTREFKRMNLNICF